MNDTEELKKCYDEVVSSYSIQPHDTELDRLRKLLDRSVVDRGEKEQYIMGLNKLVTELRERISRLEEKVETIAREKA